jgi:thermitase
MLNEGAPEVFHGSYREWRKPEQLEKDRKAARRQLKELGHPGELQKRIEQIIMNIQQRQDESPDPHALRIDWYPTDKPAGSKSSVLIARGQLVVRMVPSEESANVAATSEPIKDIMTILQDLDYENCEQASSTRKEPIRDPRTLVFGAREGVTKSSDHLKKDIDTLRKVHGIEATMNVIVPLGHIIKGDDYPTVTVGPGDLQLQIAVEDTTPSAAKVRVAVIDTGITPEDRGDNWLDSIERTPDNTERLDDLPQPPDGRLDYTSGHGTFTAGVVQQVAPHCEIISYRFTGCDGLGTEKDVAEKMIQAAEEAAAEARETGTVIHLIINASVGAPAIGKQPPIALRGAVQLIHERYPDVLIVASAGNSGTDDKMYPAGFAKQGPSDPHGFDNVVAVGALEHDLEPARFSNYGSWVTCSSIGVGVVSTFVEGREPPEQLEEVEDEIFPVDAWAVWSGTSFSAPQVSAAVARWCYEHPGLTPKAALAEILENCPETQSHGRILQLLPGTSVR